VAVISTIRKKIPGQTTAPCAGGMIFHLLEISAILMA